MTDNNAELMAIRDRQAARRMLMHDVQVESDMDMLLSRLDAQAERIAALEREWDAAREYAKSMDKAATVVEERWQVHAALGSQAAAPGAEYARGWHDALDEVLVEMTRDDWIQRAADQGAIWGERLRARHPRPPEPGAVRAEEFVEVIDPYTGGITYDHLRPSEAPVGRAGTATNAPRITVTRAAPTPEDPDPYAVVASEAEQAEERTEATCPACFSPMRDGHCTNEECHMWAAPAPREPGGAR